jgi:hypothetical protein
MGFQLEQPVVFIDTHRHREGPGASETRLRRLGEAALRLRRAAQAASLRPRGEPALRLRRAAQAASLRPRGEAACLQHRELLRRPLVAAAYLQRPEGAAFHRQVAVAVLHKEVAESKETAKLNWPRRTVTGSRG